MGKGGGGGFDTSGIEAAARESNALQKQMYEEAIARGEPFYEGGLSGFNTLLDYLGLQGGSVQSRDQIYGDLKDDYTTQQIGGGSSGDWFVSDDGRLRSRSELEDWNNTQGQRYNLSKVAKATGSPYDPNNFYTVEGGQLGGGGQSKNIAWTPFQTNQAVTDYDALNAAVDARYANQGDTPDYYGSLLQPFTLDKFEADPSYAFRQAEGQKAIERAMAAGGKTFSPEAVKALQGYNQDLASQEFGNAFNRYNIEQGNIYNRLAGIAGMGQNQVAQLNQSGQTYAGNVGATNASLAQSQLAAAQAESANKSSMWGNILGIGGQFLGAAGSAGGFGALLSDARLKENIVPDGKENGYQMYKFNYINAPEKTYRGVMAQDIIKIKPEAVIESEGMMMVDYSQLGVEMREV